MNIHTYTFTCTYSYTHTHTHVHICTFISFIHIHVCLFLSSPSLTHTQAISISPLTSRYSSTRVPTVNRRRPEGGGGLFFITSQVHSRTHSVEQSDVIVECCGSLSIAELSFCKRTLKFLDSFTKKCILGYLGEYWGVCGGGALQHAATCCNMLQLAATSCNLVKQRSTLQYTATHCNTLQHAPTHCNTMQYSATHCYALQYTATHCKPLQRTCCSGETQRITFVICNDFFVINEKKHKRVHAIYFNC